MENRKKWADRLLTLAFGICVLAVVWVLVQVTSFTSFRVPARGQEVVMDTLAAKMYGRLIAWEQKQPLTVRDGNVCLGDSLIRTYCFKENYYFMGGDNLDNSNDSRYWGLVPEPYIVGVARRVWKSVSPQSGEVRWNRIMKKIE